MSTDEALERYLEEYRSLSAEDSQVSVCDSKIFRKLRDLIIAEVYFMKRVRFLITDEEMSGFILFVIKDIATILDDYDSSRGRFSSYLKQSMENRAYNYMERNRRPELLRLLSHDLPSWDTVSEATPEYKVIRNEERENEKAQSRMVKTRIRYACLRNPGVIRKLFIFLLTICPYLPVNVIDSFCVTVNCNRTQTIAIADHLAGLLDSSARRRSDRAYLKRRADFYWAKVIDLESRMESSLRPEKYRARLDYAKARLRELNRDKEKAKLRVPYHIVGDLLNLQSSYVAKSVHYSKSLLRKLAGSTKGLSERCMASLRNRVLPVFMPFSEFGITAIRNPLEKAAPEPVCVEHIG